MKLPSAPQPQKPRARNKAELAFLPAALEIVETPPPPLAGAIGAAIIAVFCLAIAWASIGRVDIVATAPGKIIPSERTKVIQPFETGVVRAIHVSDGQSVAAGQVLIELDSTMNDAERDHLRSDLRSAELDVARLTAALAPGEDPMAAFHPPPDASPAMLATQRQLLLRQLDELNAKVAALASQKAEKQAEVDTTNATVAKLDALLPVLKERVDIRKTLFSHAIGSKANYLELQQSLVETEHEELVQKSRAREAEAARDGLAKQIAQAEAEFHRTLSADLVEAQRKASGLNEDLIKAERRTKLQQLTAPVDGTVQQLAVHTVGGVVTPAQALMVVVPAESRLEVEAMVSNRDIGFVHTGQPVELKIDTFNFTRYGLLHGLVLNVSQDAISRDKPADKTNDTVAGASSATSEPKGQELVYSARVSLDRTRMQVEGNLVNLSAGMAVTAEIRTGSRRVISYLLSPLLKYGQESLRER
jgi:hemolysin D